MRDRLNSNLAVVANVLSAMLVIIVGSIVRLTNLGQVPKLMFDEAWYVPDAWSLGHYGYEVTWQGIHSGTVFNPEHLKYFILQPEQSTHAPLGKWLIWLGMQFFNPTDPRGWRISVALFGVLLIALTMLLTYQLLRRSRLASWFAVIAGLFIATDPYAVTMSRVAILDTFLAVFVAAGTLFTVMEHNRYYLDGKRPKAWLNPLWLVAAVSFGAAAAVKLSALPFFAIYIVYLLVETYRRSARDTMARSVINSTISAATASVLMVSAYLASWAGWVATGGGWYRFWTEQNPGSAWPLFPNWMRSLFQYQVEKIHEVSSFTAADYLREMGKPDTNASPAWTWLIGSHPVTMFQAAKKTSNDILFSSVATIPNVAFWWTASAAVLALAIYALATRRFFPALLPVLGIAAGLGPWLFSGDRLVYQSYAIVFEPFLAAALVMAGWLLLRFLVQRFPHSTQRALSAIILGAITLVILVFGLMWLSFSNGDWQSFNSYQSHLLFPAWGMSVHK